MRAFSTTWTSWKRVELFLMGFPQDGGYGAGGATINGEWAWMGRSNKRLGDDESILCITKDKCQMVMCSIAEIGVDWLAVGFELVAELIKRLGVRFALKFGEFGKLKIGLPVIDAGGDHYYWQSLSCVEERLKWSAK
jgi:hypothetical protein